jgi:hypothetical protein
VTRIAGLTAFCFGLLCMITLPSTAHASAWTPPLLADAPGTIDQWYPRLAIGTDGTLWMTWMASDSLQGDEEAFVSHWIGAGWSPPVAPSGPNQIPDRFPEIASGNDGTMWILWTSLDSSAGLAGLLTHGGVSGWSTPDTIWTGGGAHDSYELAVDSEGGVWIARDGQGAAITVYHFVDGTVQEVRSYTDPTSSLFLPTVSVSPSGDVWIAWTGVPPQDPHQTKLHWVRVRPGEWAEPQEYGGILAVNRGGVTFDTDGSPWLVASGRLPTTQFFEDGSVFGAKWNGTGWNNPIRISDLLDPYASHQSGLTVKAGIGSSGGSAAWIAEQRGPPLKTTVLVSRLEQGAWSAPIAIDSSPDATEKQFPVAIAQADGSVWAAYMQRKSRSSLHSIYSSVGGATATGFTQNRIVASHVPAGARLKWQILPERTPTSASIFWSQDTLFEYGTPDGSQRVLVNQIAGTSVLSGSLLDVPRHVLTPGAYWLRASSPVGPPFWVGPAVIASTSVAGSDLVITSNPSVGTVRFLLSGPTTSGSGVLIFNVQGQLVRKLTAGAQGDGLGGVALTWDGRNLRGGASPSGVYYAVPTPVGGPHSGRFILLH